MFDKIEQAKTIIQNVENQIHLKEFRDVVDFLCNKLNKNPEAILKFYQANKHRLEILTKEVYYKICRSVTSPCLNDEFVNRFSSEILESVPSYKSMRDLIAAKKYINAIHRYNLICNMVLDGTLIIKTQ